MSQKVLDELEFQTKVLGGVETLGTKVGAIEQRFELLKDTPEELKRLKEEANEVRKTLVEIEKHQRNWRSHQPARKGHVSNDCARHLAGLYLACGLTQGKYGSADQAQRMENIVKDILGNAFDNKFRTALTSSDIPLPVEYSGDVVELVSQYGTARQFGTVFPLGAGSVKLPRLKTDTTFTLLAQSTAITEKSPQTEWVTFTPEKFGGLVLLPAEIDEDSIVPMGQFLARYAARNMARAEDHNFWVGTGAASSVNGTAKGLTALVVDNSKTSVTGTLGSPSEMTLTHIRRVRAVVDAAAIGMGAYYMHPTFEQHLSTLNTAGDKPYIAQGVNGASLDGFPIRWVDVMPVFTTSDAVSTVHVLFGDASFMYLGVRGGIRFQSSVEAGFATDDIYVRALERFTLGQMSTGSMAGVITHSA